MTRSNTAPAGVEIFTAPNGLREKLGPRFGGVDAAAIAKAEQALKSLSSNFAQWLQDEVTKLEGARAALHADGLSAEGMDRLYLHAHDLKGLGATYDYPLISRVARSLCKLLDSPAPRRSAPLVMVDAHINAVRAIVRDQIRDPEHPVGLALAKALEDQVNRHMAEAKGSSTKP